MTLAIKLPGGSDANDFIRVAHEATAWEIRTAEQWLAIHPAFFCDR
jgi:hypothetical protein